MRLVSSRPFYPFNCIICPRHCRLRRFCPNDPFRPHLRMWAGQSSSETFEGGKFYQLDFFLQFRSQLIQGKKPTAELMVFPPLPTALAKLQTRTSFSTPIYPFRQLMAVNWIWKISFDFMRICTMAWEKKPPCVVREVVDQAWHLPRRRQHLLEQNQSLFVESSLSPTLTSIR